MNADSEGKHSMLASCPAGLVQGSPVFDFQAWLIVFADSVAQGAICGLMRERTSKPFSWARLQMTLSKSSVSPKLARLAVGDTQLAIQHC